MAMIPTHYLNSVVAIGINNNIWIGTGFIVGRYYKNDDNNHPLFHLFLITNKHVFGNEKSIIARFNPQNNKPSIDYPVHLVDTNNNKLWTGHPDPDIDIASIFIDANVLKNDAIDYGFFQSNNDIITLANMKSMGLAEGDNIYILGYPMNLVGKDREYVICRNGSISRIRDMLDNRNNYYLVDSTVFPGNSGGPVILRPEILSIQGTASINKAMLIGIVRSYVPYIDVAISNQTKRPRVTFEENSGLTEVLPSEYIIQTIDLEFQNKIVPLLNNVQTPSLNTP